MFQESLWVKLCTSPTHQTNKQINNIKVLTLVPVNVTLFGNRIFADDQVKMSSLGGP